MVWACNCLAGKEFPMASSRWTTPQWDPSRRNLNIYSQEKRTGQNWPGVNCQTTCNIFLQDCFEIGWKSLVFQLRFSLFLIIAWWLRTTVREEPKVRHNWSLILLCGKRRDLETELPAKLEAPMSLKVSSPTSRNQGAFLGTSVWLISPPAPHLGGGQGGKTSANSK